MYQILRHQRTHIESTLRPKYSIQKHTEMSRRDESQPQGEKKGHTDPLGSRAQGVETAQTFFIGDDDALQAWGVFAERRLQVHKEASSS